jgi:hypothetical protein
VCTPLVWRRARGCSASHLGFEVGTGKSVAIPLAHTFVTGQTQLSGKTTTLRAIVGRSGRRALAFVTKRGEQFEGRRIKPYLPREGERPIHWRLVETILSSALGQRSMKYERYWLVNASKGAMSLADVRRNVDRLRAKAKGSTAEVYELIGEYIDLVLPEMKALAAADTLDLEPGLNVMDLASTGPQLQALVIRAAMERINQHEKGVLTVFPEAWEFAPRGRAAPAKDEAIAMARKGGVLGNFLLCDSQDIAGVETTVRQAASVWLLGVQREANELRRTLDVVRSSGIAAPKPSAVATLELGQFYACWGRNAIRTYAQPPWMLESEAVAIAVGQLPLPVHKPKEDHTVSPKEADDLRAENRRLQARIEELEASIAFAGADARSLASDLRTGSSLPSPAASNGSVDSEALYQSLLARLLKEPKLLKLQLPRPEIRVEETHDVIEVDGKTLRGRLALMILNGYFDTAKTSGDLQSELSKRGINQAAPNISKELASLAEMGFLTKQNKWWQAVEGSKANIKK